MAYASIFKADLFSGQTLIVTGGGSGIGRCTAHELAALGARVLLVGRKPEKLQKVAAEIAEDGGRAHWHACDIRDEDAVKQLVTELIAEHGPIHGLVNNAGGQYPSPLAAINQKGFETVLRTNLVGGFLMAREVFNQSMSKHGGSIVNMLADMWAACPAWAIPERHVRGWTTSPRPPHSSGVTPGCGSMRWRRGGSRPAAWTLMRARSKR